MNHIDLQKMDLNLLVVFDCIYNEGNLTRAGQHLGRTQSAISHSLDRLRTLFSDRLFVRTAQGMRPTARAHQLAPPIAQALDALSKAMQETDTFSARDMQRSFRLSMSDYSESLILPALCQHVYREAANTQIEVVPTPSLQTQNALENGYIDLLLGNQDISANTYRQELFTDEFVCIADTHHAQIKRKLTLKQFCQFPHIVFAPHGGGDRLVESTLKRQRIERRIALRVPRIHAIAPLLHDTPYIATVPAKFAAIAGDHLKILKPPMELPSLQVMQYWHEALHRDPAHRWLRQQIFELCRNA